MANLPPGMRNVAAPAALLLFGLLAVLLDGLPAEAEVPAVDARPPTPEGPPWLPEVEGPALVAGDAPAAAAVAALDAGAASPHRGQVAVRPLRSEPGDDAAIDRQLGRQRPATSEPPGFPPAAAVSSADDLAIARQLAAAKAPRPGMAVQVDRHRLVLPPARIEAESWPFRYAEVRRAVPVYAVPGGGVPTSWLDATGRWVAIADQVEVAGRQWYRLATGGWTPAEVVSLGQPSTFRGVELEADPPAELGFVVSNELSVYPRAGGGDRRPPVAVLHRYDAVPVLEEREEDGTLWLRIGEGLWVEAGSVRRVQWASRPEAVGADEKWIDVNLTRQTLVAYEGDRPVYATLVSGGLPRHPTWQGLSPIWVKYLWTKMSGGERAEGDYYYLDHVPYTMYFHLDYGLHAAYWHDDFGRPKSHGCVNLSPADAGWLFYWTAVELPPGERVARPTEAEPGTWVWTHR